MLRANIDNAIVIDSSLKEKHLYRASSTNSNIMHQIRPHYCPQFWNEDLHDSDEERDFLSSYLFLSQGSTGKEAYKMY